MTGTTDTAKAARVSHAPQLGNRGPVAAFAASWIVAIATTLAILLLDMPRELVGLLGLVLVISLLMGGIPIGLGMIAASFIGVIALRGAHAVAPTFQELIYGSTASWSMSVVPLFILMGIALWKSGITNKGFNAATKWLGNLPGGLAIATNFSGAGLAAASGSSLGISYALGRIAIPEMLRAGYKPSLATGTVAMAGTLGQLIPPSILLVVYAGVAQTAVGPQLVAALIPGIVMATAYAVLILVRATISPELAPRADLKGVTWGDRIRSLGDMVPLTVVIVIVMGGLLFGIFTPTEAGAVGALAAVVVGWFSGQHEEAGLKGFLRFMKETLVATIVSAAGIFLMLIGVATLTRFLTLSRLTTSLTEWIVNLGLDRLTFLLLLVLLYLVLGMFLDPLAMILLTVPVLYAPLTTLGIDMIWFGVFLVILCEVGQVSPPIGILSFVVHRIAQEPEVNLGHKVPLTEVFKGVVWFIITTLIVLGVLIVWPDMALWLPSLTK